MKEKGYIYGQSSLFGKDDVIGFGCSLFYIKEIDRLVANKIIKEHHYSHKFYNLSYIHLGVFIEDNLVGVLQFGYAMNPASGGSVVKGTGNKEYLELNRMFLFDSAPKNSESKAISYCIKYIKSKYKAVKWIQSFADQRCGKFGIVYQACSFSYFGEHINKFWELDGETFHNSIKTRDKSGLRGFNLLNDPKNKERVIRHELRQFRYIKFIDKRARKYCTLTEQPYPKHYEEDL